jgi:hypothetical protein
MWTLVAGPMAQYAASLFFLRQDKRTTIEKDRGDDC